MIVAGLATVAAGCGEAPTGPEEMEEFPEIRQNPIVVPGIEVTVDGSDDDDDWSCEESPTCSGGDGGGDGGDGGSGGDGGTGGSSGGDSGDLPDLPDSDCDPAVENCLQPLEQRHHDAIEEFMDLMAETDYESEKVANVCGVLLSKFEELYPENTFVGNPSIPDDAVPSDVKERAKTHDALWTRDPETGRESIHVDGDYFDAAIDAGDHQGIGLILLHEAAHALGEKEGWGGHGRDEGPEYTTFLYNHTSGSLPRNQGPERCVKE